jgi:hypothetical protein
MDVLFASEQYFVNPDVWICLKVPLFPRFCCLDSQPGGQLLGVRVELAWGE